MSTETTPPNTASLTPQQIAFRHAMAHLPAAVCVITTAGSAGTCGITASAVCSVTDSPPTILVCINRRSAMHDVFMQNGHLCVNVLAHEHEELAMHFSGATRMPMAERFGMHEWQPGATGQPVLASALVKLQGSIVDSKAVGSHSVLFVELDGAEVSAGQGGLVYFNRLFHAVEHGGAAV